MTLQPLYCHRCNKTYNVRVEDLELIKHHNASFDTKTYYGGCFFKDLAKIKRSQNGLKTKNRVKR